MAFLRFSKKHGAGVDIFRETEYHICICRCGGIGRHKGLKIPRQQCRTGSSPVSGTTDRVFITLLRYEHSFFMLFYAGILHGVRLDAAEPMRLRICFSLK